MPGAALRFIARLCRSEATAGDLTSSAGIRRHRLAPRCALPGPRALRPRAAAAASHAASRQRPGTCPSGSALGSAPPPPRLGRPARSGPLCSRLFFFFPLSLSLLTFPPPSFRLLLYLVFCLSKSRHKALQVEGGSLPPHELFLCLVVAVVATARRSSFSSSRAPPPPPPSPRTASTGVMHKLPATDPNLPGF